MGWLETVIIIGFIFLIIREMYKKPNAPIKKLKLQERAKNLWEKLK